MPPCIETISKDFSKSEVIFLFIKDKPQISQNKCLLMNKVSLVTHIRYNLKIQVVRENQSLSITGCYARGYSSIITSSYLRYNTQAVEIEWQECHIQLDKMNRYKHSSLF